jgi:hypothetical protein
VFFFRGDAPAAGGGDPGAEQEVPARGQEPVHVFHQFDEFPAVTRESGFVFGPKGFTHFC